MNNSKSFATIKLPVSNPYSIACFSDFMAEAQRLFQEESEAKNRAYDFILSRGLLDEYTAFFHHHHTDAHADCISTLADLKSKAKTNGGPVL